MTIIVVNKDNWNVLSTQCVPDIIQKFHVH